MLSQLVWLRNKNKINKKLQISCASSGRRVRGEKVRSREGTLM
jgi:hypothetical protein